MDFSNVVAHFSVHLLVPCIYVSYIYAFPKCRYTFALQSTCHMLMEQCTCRILMECLSFMCLLYCCIPQKSL